MALGGPGWLWVAVDGIAVPASCSQLVLTVFLGNPSSFKCKLPPQVLQVFLILHNLQVYSVSVELGQTKTLFFFLKKKKKTLKKKRLYLPFCLLTDASHLHDSETMKARRSWDDIDCKNGLKSFI